MKGNFKTLREDLELWYIVMTPISAAMVVVMLILMHKVSIGTLDLKMMPKLIVTFALSLLLFSVAAISLIKFKLDSIHSKSKDKYIL